jgi:hypothetical protein
MSGYRFDAVKAKVKAGGYDNLTTDEKWQWHADVYGWRRARLGVSADVRTSPVDPEGKWFDEGRITYAENHYREAGSRKRSAVVAQRPDHARPADPDEALPIMDGWARDHGYHNLADYQESERLDYVDARCNIARSFMAAADARNRRAFAEPADADRATLLKALGVTAKERTYTPDEMRRARIALGIEEPDPPLVQLAAE